MWPFGVRAQQAKSRRVGLLVAGFASDPPTNQHGLQALLDDLRARGWEEGRNILSEGRYAGSDPVRFPELAAELVELRSTS